jgi:eukaryotic-like serine/threonine-protein kinase
VINQMVGPYRVLEKLGEGGMGEVYRARDIKLDRDVALKILPASFASDPDRVMRFQREAKALAALNHPNIAAIHEMASNEASGAPDALVMELVEGEDLAQRLARGPIAIDELLPIARQVADALEAAHEAGIVHRDLKPANVKLRADGTVKVLDFGLAKAIDSGTVSEHTGTMTSPALTQMGLILGTAAYMSPEQAKGKVVDRRADIWAFGVLLHELLTGRPLFEAETVTETLAAVLTRDVGEATLPPTTPLPLRRLIVDCLARDPRQRLRDIGEARRSLDRLMAGAVEPDTARAADARRLDAGRRWRWPAASAAMFIVGAVLSAWLLWPRPVVPRPVQFTVSPPEDVTFLGNLELSADGRRLAFVGSQAGRRRVVVHSFDSGRSQVLAATDDISGDLAWSPDGESLAYVTDNGVNRIAWTGGAIHHLCPLPAGAGVGLAWGADDVLLIGHRLGPLLRGSAAGGACEPWLALDAAGGEVRHVVPEFMPGGRRYTFVSTGETANSSATWMGEVSSTARERVEGLASTMLLGPSGDALFLQEGSLFAQPFDLERRRLAASPVKIADAVASPLSVVAPLTLSASGTLAYVAEESFLTRLVWFDRAGTRIGEAAPLGVYRDVELSPDGSSIAYEAGFPGDIWVVNLANGIPQRLTSAPPREADPAWGADSRTVVFRSDGEGGRLHAREVGATGPDRELRPGVTRDSPESWSPDGKYLVYMSEGNLWALPASGGTPLRLTDVGRGANPRNARVSPDGRWLSYESSELGRSEIFVQSFAEAGVRQRVSPSGGSDARWSRDGTELFYRVLNRLMVVPVRTSGERIEVGTAAELFQMSTEGTDRPEYAVAPNGQFLVGVPDRRAARTPITVVLNWSLAARSR